MAAGPPGPRPRPAGQRRFLLGAMAVVLVMAGTGIALLTRPAAAPRPVAYCGLVSCQVLRADNLADRGLTSRHTGSRPRPAGPGTSAPGIFARPAASPQPRPQVRAGSGSGAARPDSRPGAAQRGQEGLNRIQRSLIRRNRAQSARARAGQARPGQAGAGQARAGQSRAGQPGTSRAGTGQAAAGQAAGRRTQAAGRTVTAGGLAARPGPSGWHGWRHRQRTHHRRQRGGVTTAAGVLPSPPRAGRLRVRPWLAWPGGAGWAGQAAWAGGAGWAAGATHPGWGEPAGPGDGWSGPRWP